MSATLGAMLAQLLPDLRVVLLERLPVLAGESSGSWNNAGTGHSGYCELNYMPDPVDASKAETIARQFESSLQFWNWLIRLRELSPVFRTVLPHMDIVFGHADVDYLRRRFATMQLSPEFASMKYSEDPEVIRAWAPLVMDGRSGDEPVAATFVAGGTDIDFGALTCALADSMVRNGAEIRTSHEVSQLSEGRDGTWTVIGRDRVSNRPFRVRSTFVFVGAGGDALGLLQKSRIPEVRGYGVLPFGAEFLRTDEPTIVERHQAKVYGKPELGAPPMSLPHLDTRVVEDRSSLMFGPYATFSTKLSRNGRLSDLFKTIRMRNLPVLIAACMQNATLIRYLLGQLVSSRRVKFRQLRRYYPEVDPAQWYSVQAGQRAQLVKPHPRKIGELMFGTELVVNESGTIAGLLGASPGASVAPAIMIELLAKCFPAAETAAMFGDE